VKVSKESSARLRLTAADCICPACIPAGVQNDGPLRPPGAP
jgi:hypothetical protein